MRSKSRFFHFRMKNMKALLIAAGFAAALAMAGPAAAQFYIGARWDFTKRLGVRVEWQRYESLGGGLVETDVDALSIGIIFSFQ